MPTWNAGQYLQFAEERTQPCRDLIHRISLPAPKRIADLGCGPGNSTVALHLRWPEAEITGVDSSPDMIAAARTSHPHLRWDAGDIADWTADTPCVLVFSNAALQWVPDHAVLFPRLLRQVAPGGAFAFQVPMSFDAAGHRLMRELASSAAWRDRFSRAVRDWFVDDPAFYYDVMAPLVRRIDLWTTEYFHILAGPEAIVEWYKGTGLRPLLDLLSPEDQVQFLADYEGLLAVAYPRRADGRVLFPFLRLFLIAYP